MAALLASGADASTEVLAALDDADPNVRYQAAMGLRYGGQFHPGSASQIEAHLRSETYPEIARALRESLAFLDPVRAREIAEPKLAAAREGAPPAFGRMLDRYWQAKTYRDRSVGSVTRVDSDGRQTVTSMVSTTAFVRKGGFKWECGSDSGSWEISQCAVWTADQRSWATWMNYPGPGTGRSDGLSAVEALRMPEAGFDGVLGMIPKLLIPIAGGRTESILTLPGLIESGIEVIDRNVCVIVTATAPAQAMESARVTKLWIDDFGAIRRITINYSLDPTSLNSSSGIDPAEIATLGRLRRFDTEVRLDIEPEFDTSLTAADTEFTPPQ